MAIFGGMVKKRSGLPEDLARQAAVVGASAPVAAGGYDSFRVNGAPVAPPLVPGAQPREVMLRNAFGSPGGPSAGAGANVNRDQLLKMTTPEPSQGKRRGGIRGYLERVDWDRLQGSFLVAGAIAHGDYQSAARIMGSLGEREAAAAQQAAQMQMARQVAGLPGMSARELLAYMHDPKAWGANNSDALASHHAAVNVNQTDTRVFGDPANGGHTFRPRQTFDQGADRVEYDPQSGRTSTVHRGMTGGEQYARGLGYQPGSEKWNQAVQDAELGANGPTAFGYKDQLADQAQGYRMQTRSTPTWGQRNPRPTAPRSSRGGGSARPTARDASGRKIEWNGSDWVDQNGRPVGGR